MIKIELFKWYKYLEMGIHPEYFLLYKHMSEWPTGSKYESFMYIHITKFFTQVNNDKGFALNPGWIYPRLKDNTLTIDSDFIPSIDDKRTIIEQLFN